MPITPPSKSRLSHATSPYLEQHADNPVDWWPWCEEALQLAREEDKPILLSIGYSACHWCHVMAHESFEDVETAELMNRLFINIKVDREERPDLDKIYQNAHQLLVRRPGGWPLTLFLSPHDHTPYFCGTYFPKEPRHGLPSFKDLLLGTEQAYRQQGEAIAEQSQSLRELLHSLQGAEVDEAALTDAPIRLARDHLWDSFDHQYGGFGAAPKFPHTTSLELLLVHWADSVREGKPDEQAQHMVVHSLERMALSGLCDQIGGGFYRYSVDERWEIPHFEKMLYDNGLLLSLYSDAWQATGSPLFRRTIEQTAGWVLREMQSPEGGYYSSLDADSEGQEGRFYAWGNDELAALLDREEFDLFSLKFGLNESPNFEGRWHLHAQMDNAELAELSGLVSERVEALLFSSERKLFQAREKRVRPGCDDKVLTAWNALMIKGMARAARLLERPDLQASAALALDFIRKSLWRDGRLLASWRKGRAELPAYLDDHAFLLDALLEMLQLRWSDEDLGFAKALADGLLAHFEDSEAGGFFFTADDHESLIQRPKPWTDDAMPSGNGVAAHALGRLGHLLSEPRYLDAAERAMKVAKSQLDHSPSACGSLLLGLKELLIPPELIMIRGAETLREQWQRSAMKGYAPHRLSYAVPMSGSGDLGASNAGENSPGAVICRGTHCLPPVTELSDFDRLLKDGVAI